MPTVVTASCEHLATELRREREFAVFIRDTRGRVAAGVSGIVLDRCCELESLWVDERLRGRGVARDLMAAAEAEAARQGAAVILFHSYDLLVQGLHERLGYRSVAAVDGCVGGSAVRWFRKDLPAATGSMDEMS